MFVKFDRSVILKKPTPPPPPEFAVFLIVVKLFYVLRKKSRVGKVLLNGVNLTYNKTWFLRLYPVQQYLHFRLRPLNQWQVEVLFSALKEAEPRPRRESR